LNLSIRLNPGDFENGQEGTNIMTVLGQNMAWLLKKLA
jgi:hypothetical protein